jgi:hypothetical protein
VNQRTCIRLLALAMLLFAVSAVLLTGLALYIGVGVGFLLIISIGAFAEIP